MRRHLSDLGAALLVTATMVAVVLAVTMLLTGCGRRTDAMRDTVHTALDHVTDAADPAYGLTVAACDARESAIVYDEARSLEDRRDAFDQVRATCDNLFAAFEALREAQLFARVAVDEAAAGAEDWDHALEAAHTVGDAWRATRTLLMAVPWLRPPTGADGFPEGPLDPLAPPHPPAPRRPPTTTTTE